MYSDHKLSTKHDSFMFFSLSFQRHKIQTYPFVIFGGNVLISEILYSGEFQSL